jgi:hypothetical protein
MPAHGYFVRRHRDGFLMLHPQQFEVNEAWIAFRLNGAPVRTERDGDFNCLALMDAASCFILGSQFIAATAAEPTRAQFRHLLQEAARHKQQLPTTLLIAREDVADLMTREATHQNIDVVRVPESELLVFIAEARRSFAERFEEGRE